jgi:membrane protein DedA with SNARE-associated domain
MWDFGEQAVCLGMPPSHGLGSLASGKASETCGAWLERHAAGAIVGSRFLPGTRLPLYVMAGFVRLPVAIFAAWAFIGALLWTPVLVLLTAKLGDAFITRLSAPTSIGWLGSLLTAAVILGILHLWRGHLGPRSRG